MVKAALVLILAILLSGCNGRQIETLVSVAIDLHDAIEELGEANYFTDRDTDLYVAKAYGKLLESGGVIDQIYSCMPEETREDDPVLQWTKYTEKYAAYMQKALLDPTDDISYIAAETYKTMADEIWEQMDLV